MTSILTNNGAMVALQTLKSINNDLATTQSEISTGKEVATAKDNAAIWAISKVMESDVEGFKSISDSLSIGESTVSVARTAAETTTDLLKQMKEKIIAAQDGTVDRDTLQQDIDALKEQITSVTGAAQFNGVNLVNGSAAALVDDAGNAIDVNGDGTPDAADTGIRVVSSLDRSSTGVTTSRIDVAAHDLSITALKGNVDSDAGTSLALADLRVNVASDDTTTTDGGTSNAIAALTAIEDMIGMATEAAASFGSAQNRIEIQNDFVNKLADTLTSGIGSMVDADMEEASARLKALQTQQQLGVQSLSIANQAPGAIMALFR